MGERLDGEGTDEPNFKWGIAIPNFNQQEKNWMLRALNPWANEHEK